MSENNRGNPWGKHRQQGRGRPAPPDFDEVLSRGVEGLRRRFGRGGERGGGARGAGRGGAFLLAGFGLIAWLYASVYKVRPEEAAVVLTFGEYTQTVGQGLHVAFWPVQTYEILPVTRENAIDVGFRSPGGATALANTPVNRGFFSQRETIREESLMLTGDENIVDINFQVVWNIANPATFLFNLTEPQLTIKAVAESAMREVIGRSNLKPVLNRDRAQISEEVARIVQATLNGYRSGVNIVRVNFDRADPPREVIDAFRDVQAAEQDRDTLEKRAGAEANKKLAEARGEAEQILQEAEAYRAQAVKEAEGDAARFVSVHEEYARAPEVTRKRLYLETMETVLGSLDKIIVDDVGGSGVVPYLPLDAVRRQRDQ